MWLGEALRRKISICLSLRFAAFEERRALLAVGAVFWFTFCAGFEGNLCVI
jgi:hypothetical protein